VEWVSRRVGELVRKRAGGRGPGGAPHALNDPDSCPLAATPSAPTGRDTRSVVTHHCSYPALGALPEGARPAGGILTLVKGWGTLQCCTDPGLGCGQAVVMGDRHG
jgi:hypothetical protein